MKQRTNDGFIIFIILLVSFLAVGYAEKLADDPYQRGTTHETE